MLDHSFDSTKLLHDDPEPTHQQRSGLIKVGPLPPARPRKPRLIARMDDRGRLWTHRPEGDHWTLINAPDDARSPAVIAHRYIATGVWRANLRHGSIISAHTGESVATLNDDGYAVVGVHVPNVGTRYVRVHRLIYERVHGPIPQDLTVDHKDGIKTNNRPTNLQLLSTGENVRDAARRGVHPVPPLDAQQLALIRRLAANHNVPQIAKVTGLSARRVRSVLSGKTYRAVQ